MPRRRDLTNIPKHVYRELYHFCLQYGDFKTKLRSCYSISSPKMSDAPRNGSTTDQVSANAERAIKLQSDIDLIEQTAKEVCPGEYPLLLLAVTREDVTFTNLKMMHNMKMGKEKFKQVRRRFFYRLAEKTGKI